MEIWRIQVVKAATGYRSTATIYNYIKAGIWTKPSVSASDPWAGPATR